METLLLLKVVNGVFSWIAFWKSQAGAWPWLLRDEPRKCGKDYLPTQLNWDMSSQDSSLHSCLAGSGSWKGLSWWLIPEQSHLVRNCRLEWNNLLTAALNKKQDSGLLTAILVRANPTLLFSWLYNKSCSNGDLSPYFGGMLDLKDEMHSCLSAHAQSGKSSH